MYILSASAREVTETSVKNISYRKFTFDITARVIYERQLICSIPEQTTEEIFHAHRENLQELARSRRIYHCASPESLYASFVNGKQIPVLFLAEGSEEKEIVCATTLTQAALLAP